LRRRRTRYAKQKQRRAQQRKSAWDDKATHDKARIFQTLLYEDGLEGGQLAKNRNKYAFGRQGRRAALMRSDAVVSDPEGASGRQGASAAARLA
jgi:hypothetical protein